jgi:hypothetical protein
MRSISMVGVAAVALCSTGTAYGGSFDGSYQGVSSIVKLPNPAQARHSHCQSDGVPDMLIVSNGAVAWRNVFSTAFQRNIDPVGDFLIRSPHGMRMVGHIDEQGVARGQLQNGSCYFDYTWRKAP